MKRPTASAPVRIALVTQDGEAVAAARRRLEGSGFAVVPLAPAHHLPRGLRAARARVAVLDIRRGGPLLQRALRALSDAPDTAAVPLLVFDPEGTLDFSSDPFGILRSLDGPAFLGLLRDAAAAGDLFEKAGNPDIAHLKVSEAALKRFLELVQRNTGILVEKGSVNAAEEVLRRRMFARKCLSGWEYLNHLQFHDEAGSEFRRIIPAITVGETSFFRTGSHFAALKRVVIPDILARKTRGRSRIRVWSAGCATGEEAYSLAITFHQEIADLHAWDFQVIATDINPVAVRAAEQGVYREKDLRRVPAVLRKRYFVRIGEDFIVDDSIRQLVDFRVLNLNSWACAAGFEGIEPGVDLIFCENVIIYFGRPVIERVIQRFFNVLNPAGHLFLGYSESLYKVENAFQNVSFQETFFYRKAGDTDAAPLPERRRSTRRFVPVPRPAASLPPVPPAAPPEPAVAAPLPPPPPAPRAVETGEGGLEELDPEVRRSFRAIRDGRFDIAASLLEEFTRRFPLDPEGHYLLGLAAEALGDEERALLQWRRALFLDPDRVGAHLRLGDHFARVGAADTALLHFRNALRALKAGAEPQVLTPEGVLAGPALLDLCRRTVRALESEEVA